MKLQKSLEIWERYGRHLLIASPYKDAVIAAAQGCTFTDADGNDYLDMSSGQICAVAGHGHPVLLERVIDQIRRVAHTGTSFFSPVVFEASARLMSVVPGGLEKCLFLSTGAEANEYAIRLARVYTGKTGVLALTKGYAGLTLQTSSLTNYGKSAKPIVPGTGYIQVPDPTACPSAREPLEWGRELIEQSLEVNRGLLDNVAAIIFEPILSAGGLIVLPDGYMRELRALATSLGALLIADEAQTGMGRTGKWFGIQHDDIVPDILVLSKGAGGGFPSSAVVTTAEINEAVMGRVNQFSSHQSDPLGAAATLAVVEIIERDGLVGRADEMGRYMRDRLNDIAGRYPHLQHVRGRGLMVGFDVFRDPARPVADSAVGRSVEDFCRAQGVHFEAIQRNRFRILPPLTITKAEIDRFVTAVEGAMKAVADGTAVPRAPLNRYSVAFEERTSAKRGLKAAARWALTHTPLDWLEQVRERTTSRGGGSK
jgi:2,2-dialkylglycine decarboxylase (pyruvate)